MKKIKKSIGINVDLPKEKCNDKKCPFHGSLKIRGRTFRGTVVSADVHKSVTVSWEWQRYIPKYERYEKRRTKLRAHNPPCINAKVGDWVMIAECRPLSKTKNFVIIKKIGEDIRYKAKKDVIEENKLAAEKKRKEKEKTIKKEFEKNEEETNEEETDEADV